MSSSSEDSSNQSIRVEEANTDALFNYVFTIRTEVFVDERSIDQEDEYDGFDHLSTHFLAWYGNNPAGAARRRRLNNGSFRLERFAVLAEHRNKGVGAALVMAGLEGLPPGQLVIIHPTVETVSYFEKFGFEAIGEEFEEAGIPTMEMRYQIPAS